jgi:hypothetical protein
MDRKEACRILNLSSDATDNEIRTSFLELSKKYHPDHNCDHIAHDMFVLINNAYKLLTSTSEPRSQTRSQTPPQKQAPSSMIDINDMINHMLSPSRNFALDNVKLIELQNIATRYKIDITHLSEQTHRPIKKRKNDLFYDIKKTNQFQKLQKLSYNELVTLCGSKNIPITDIHGRHKSTIELSIGLL